MSVTYHAQYSDGATYQVVYDTSERKTYLRTTDGGFMDVPRFVNGAEFVAYAFDYTPPKGLRGCDWATNVERLHAHLALLTPPTRPAAPPVPQTQPEDFRIHVEGGGDSFRALQEAGARGEMEYRANRQQARREMLDTLNRPDPNKVRREESVRGTKNERAAQMRPRGGGQFIVKNRGE